MSRSTLSVLLLFIAGLALTASAASATELESYKGWRISSFELEGVRSEIKSELARGLFLSGESKLFRTERPRFYPSLLEEDLARAHLFLARRGHPRAKITPDIRANESKRSLQIVLRVEAGPAIGVRRTQIDFLPPEIATEVRELPLKTGTPFTDAALVDSAREIESVLHEEGFAEATVETEVSASGSDSVDVRLVAHPGQRFVFGELEVHGTRPDLERLVRRVSGIGKGDRYAPSTLRSAQDELRRLDLFRQVRVSSESGGGDELNVRFDLIEQPRRSLEFSVGYLTDDQFWGRARWKHRNLFGRGRGFESEASASRYLWRLAASSWYPAIGGRLTHATLRASIEEQSEENYTERTHQLGLTFRNRLTSRASWYAQVAFSEVLLDLKTDDVDAFQEDGGLLTFLTLGYDRDGSDDPLFPTRGSISSVRARGTPVRLISRAEFVSLEARHSFYRSVFGSTVLAGRVGTGIAAPFGDSADLLPRFRFYAGGASSMRGFGRRKLGPTDSDGEAIGGQALLEAAVELRFPIIRRTFGAIFVDSGQVWPDRRSIALDELEWAVGPALMIRTPVGPIRGDLGWRLTNLDSQEPDWVFHLTIGQPF